jgi:DNA-binding NarL/FixJ family response regulator
MKVRSACAGLEAIRALAARLQRDLAKQLAETRIPHANVPAWLPALLEKEGFADLTDRQQEVLLLLLQGYSTDEVARQLHVSRAAVTQTLARIRRILAEAGAARTSAKATYVAVI